MKRIAIVDNEKLKDMQKKRYIQSICPVNRAGKECIKIEADGRLTIDEALCTGCGICPKAAIDSIRIVNLPELLNQKPIHRYGENQFVLFNLPTPMFGKVVGLLGVNGIGKSTAIKILAQVLKPNLGDYENDEVDFNKLMEFFKGTEAQLFFEKVKKGEIKISYKPQQVDLIPKKTKGKVKELLQKVDEKKELKKICEILDLNEILETDITKISGGELQRVAIAATVLKKANLYIFDEPTSYLDIKQRLKISKFIKGLADDKTAVIVVEHDLIILDFMTDLVQIMHGKEESYGVVAMPKATKTAINTYLSGYLKEENIRFRDYKIKFEKNPPLNEKEKPIIVEWTNIERNLGKFNLSSTKGNIMKHDSIGILGENGIGKTTFVKILAGVEDLAKGEISKNINVAYKPQYLQSDSEELVITFLKEAISKFTTQIINPLNIKPLLEKQLNQLSGGELQRVSIAKALSQDADLFLLDEPSAYLDVEQRLIISKVIRDLLELSGKSALIVDHDLLFIDYTSKKLMVFEGKPAIKGEAKGPFSMEDGMTLFLKDLSITFRRDEESNRPRTNKEGSVKDREQKKSGKYYYT